MSMIHGLAQACCERLRRLFLVVGSNIGLIACRALKGCAGFTSLSGIEMPRY
jgi:hypothetical protein